MQLRISLLNILHLRDLLTEYEAKQIEFNRIWEISANIIKAVADPKKKAKLNLIRNKLGSFLCPVTNYNFPNYKK